MMAEKKEANYQRGIFITLLFICVVSGVAILKFTAAVVLPLVIAILLSLVFEPIVAMFHRQFKMPWFLGIFIVIILFVIGMTIVGSVLFSSFKTILAQYPKYESRFKIVYSSIAVIFDLPYDAENSLFDNLWGQFGIRSQIQNMALSLSGSFITIVRQSVVVFIFIAFFLMEFKNFREKAQIAFEGSAPGRISGIITDIIFQITRYLSVKFFISLLTGGLVYLGMLIIGVDFPILWGFISFVLNFIPNFGSILAGVLAALFSLVQFWPKPEPVFAVIGIMLAVNMVLGNFIEPRVQGRNLGLSPFIIVASLSFWGWIWGFSGLIIGVPMMVLLKIICDNVSMLRSVSILMGSFPSIK
jgi:predicted PurR-regulated permease PerM